MIAGSLGISFLTTCRSISTEKKGELFLDPQNRILCRFGDSEFDHGLGWNFNFLLRLWIETRPRFPLLLNELAKAGQNKFPALFNFFVGDGAQRLEEYSRGFPVGLGGCSECDLKFGLGHV
jgi:hypothetical protein